MGLKTGSGVFIGLFVGLLAAGSMDGARAGPDTALGKVTKVAGTVRVLPEDGIRKEPAEAGTKLFAGDQLLTLADSRAAVRLGENRVALDANSKLRLKAGGSVSQSQGQAYYEVADRGAEGFRVRTGFAVIGVKGTRFLVRDHGEGSSGGQAVAMREGRVGVEALKGEFELYKRRQRAAFERFKQRRRQEFEAFKQRRREAFVGRVKSFDLDDGRAVTFDGSKALSQEVSEDMATDMDRLEQWL